MGDPRRIQMLALLMEDCALTAKELALGAGITPATASSHLKRLLDDGLLAALAEHLPAQRWMERKKHSRVVRVTDLSQARLTQLGLRPAG